MLPSRKPSDSINFVIAHDGFTLADWVAYNEKHNGDNGEFNRTSRGLEKEGGEVVWLVNCCWGCACTAHPVFILV